MEARKYWLEFIGGVIDRSYQKKDMDENRSSAYNDGIKYAAIKEVEEALYRKTIDELVETKIK